MTRNTSNFWLETEECAQCGETREIDTRAGICEGCWANNKDAVMDQRFEEKRDEAI